MSQNLKPKKKRNLNHAIFCDESVNSAAVSEHRFFRIANLFNCRAIEKVQRHVDDAIEQGGVLRAGGKVDAELGPLFFQPTLVVDVPKSAQVHKEETFGPFAAVTK